MTHEEAGTVFLVILRFLIEDLRTQEPRLDFPLFFYLQVLLSLEEKRKCGKEHIQGNFLACFYFIIKKRVL